MLYSASRRWMSRLEVKNVDIVDQLFQCIFTPLEAVMKRPISSCFISGLHTAYSHIPPKVYGVWAQKRAWRVGVPVYVLCGLVGAFPRAVEPDLLSL